ncbi:MAG: diguanylate cyclase, partial [Anaerolineaceae bacterium]|nr:diguanylate cyclase [Anaerolineaceae bacterium]
LQDTAALLNSSLKFNEIIDRILDNVGKVVPHDAANIMLIENGKTRVIAYNGYKEMGVEEFINKASYDVHEIPTFSKMFFEKEPSIITNTQGNSNWKTNPESSMVRSFIGAPIISRDQVIGFINLDSFSADFFTTTHAARLKTFADQAGVAVEKAQLYEEIQQLAITDDLTGVLNRRGLFTQGAHETERSLRFSRPLCALMLDIDHFKFVNDRYGHPAGDQILKQLAGKCRKCIREVDVLGRYGGEEFVILLLECEIDKAEKIAERIRAAIEATHFQSTNEEISITISIGVAAMKPEIKDFEKLVSLADQALYQAKQKGRNNVATAK